MNKSLVTAPLVVCMGFALAFSGNVGSAIAEDAGLLADIPPPPGSKSLGTEAGQQASYSTSANPDAVINSYKQARCSAIIAKLGRSVVGLAVAAVQARLTNRTIKRSMTAPRVAAIIAETKPPPRCRPNVGNKAEAINAPTMPIKISPSRPNPVPSTN